MCKILQAVQVKLFIDDLNKTGKFEDLKYTFWDECYTSKVKAFRFNFIFWLDEFAII